MKCSSSGPLLSESYKPWLPWIQSVEVKESLAFETGERNLYDSVTAILPAENDDVLFQVLIHTNMSWNDFAERYVELLGGSSFLFLLHSGVFISSSNIVLLPDPHEVMVFKDYPGKHVFWSYSGSFDIKTLYDSVRAVVSAAMCAGLSVVVSDGLTVSMGLGVSIGVLL